MQADQKADSIRRNVLAYLLEHGPKYEAIIANHVGVGSGPNGKIAAGMDVRKALDDLVASGDVKRPERDRHGALVWQAVSWRGPWGGVPAGTLGGNQ